MTSTITTVRTIVIHDDGDQLAGAPSPCNEPDLYDREMAWWLAPEAAIGCDIALLPAVAGIVAGGSFLARRGIAPSERGIIVVPFNPDRPQDVSTTVVKCGALLDQWWLAHRAIVPEEN